MKAPAISGEDVFPNTVVHFPLSEVRRLTGLDLPALRVTELLTRLGFHASGAGTTLHVAVPSWRPDVTQKADLVEEVMRMEGIDRVPVDPLPRLSGVAPRMLTGIQNRRRATKRVLAAPRSKASASTKGAPVDNTVIELWPSELATAGSLNREPLIAQRMLTTGQARDVAAAEVDTTLELLEQFGLATLRLQASDTALIFDLETRLNSDAHSSTSR